MVMYFLKQKKHLCSGSNKKVHKKFDICKKKDIVSSQKEYFCKEIYLVLCFPKKKTLVLEYKNIMKNKFSFW
jgi:hypothetical protein